jgi:DNA-binding SARP family transcriptional activator
LGDLSLIIGEREVVVGQAVAEVLALLGIAGPMSRKRMQATLWPSSDPLLTTGRLRSLVYRARQLFGTDLIMSDPQSSIGLNLAVLVDFRVAVDAAAGVQQGWFPAPAGLHGLIRLLGSELLPLCGWEWLEQYQHSWSRSRLRALIACAHGAARIGDHETVITACEQVILAEPFHEQAHYLMISEMLREGYENTAREVYGRLRRMLADELGCLPQCSYEELRTGDLADRRR